MRVAVTGGSGRAGRYIIPELAAHGHEVVNIDIARGEAPATARFMRCDVTDYGQTLECLRGAEAVIHMAAIPSPIADPPHVVFQTNVAATWNVLQAAEALGIGKLVLASSINAIGASFSLKQAPPEYFPIDEAHPTRAEDPYALSKWVGEQIADGFARRRPVQIASLRLHGLWTEARIDALRKSPVKDPRPQAKNFWGYLDLRDCARVCRMAIETSWQGHEAFFINARDTMLDVPTAEAIKQAYPGVPLRRDLPGFAAVIDASKAKRVFGWEPLHSWRDAPGS